MSVIARALEVRGLPTLMMSTLLDVSEAYKPPRSVVVQYPLGAPCGRVDDAEHQRQTLRDAFATPLDRNEWLVNQLDLEYGPVGDTTWQQKTFDLYEEGWHIADDHIMRHRAEGGGRPLAGREREFTIKCDC